MSAAPVIRTIRPKTAGAAAPAPAFDLKGAAFTILVLSLRNHDMETISAQLAEKVRQAPDFFHHAPLVINLRYLPAPEQIDLVMLLDIVQGRGFIPVGITDCTERQQEQAGFMGLAVLTTRTVRNGRQQEQEEEVNEAKELEKKPENTKSDEGKSCSEGGSVQAPPSALIITEPVRSGQRVTAEHGDLIVMASVSSGAEISAPGNIHVYGTLRGRAFAGNNGRTDTCIFCQQLEAELVAVAGVYMVNEHFPDSLRSKAVQIRLEADRIRIAPLH
ncbi:MAG: septum site-determining protein MinC [Candidatus Electrothrix sp. YB6]